MSNIKLRAHHGLCILFFQGKGYNNDFVINMTSFIDKLEQNPELTIVASEDTICEACPNKKNGACEQNDKVNAMDQVVMSLCDIVANTILAYEEFKTLINTKVIEAGKMNIVCGKCQWAYICLDL